MQLNLNAAGCECYEKGYSEQVARQYIEARLPEKESAEISAEGIAAEAIHCHSLVLHEALEELARFFTKTEALLLSIFLPPNVPPVLLTGPFLSQAILEAGGIDVDEVEDCYKSSDALLHSFASTAMKLKVMTAADSMALVDVFKRYRHTEHSGSFVEQMQCLGLLIKESEDPAGDCKQRVRTGPVKTRRR